MTVEELEQKYSQVPFEIKQAHRWICYTIIQDKDTREDRKVPTNPMTGRFASSTDPSTWSTFKVAIMGCVKYNFYGIGFVLGEDKSNNTSYFGIDLDNHPDKVTGIKMSEDDFYNLTSEFVNELKSYSEYSHSGEGVHIICKGKLPAGARRKKGVPVEMYDSGRFFTMTGNIISNLPINERTEEIKPLWEKYLNRPEETQYKHETGIYLNNDGSVVFGGADRIERTEIELSAARLSDTELIEKIKSSEDGPSFMALYNGDMSAQANDHSGADLAFCKKLAFWTRGDTDQMDRIFRSSALMRTKWDQKRGSETYGEMTINKAVSNQMDFYTPPKQKIVINVQQQEIRNDNDDVVVFDDKKDPIINTKQIFKHYPLTDTGNAERFYDQFGDFFRYNTDNKFFVFWNGKTWIRDQKKFIRKYANKIIDVLKDEINQTQREIEEESKKEDKDVALIEKLQAYYKGQEKNLTRVSNKAGKDAMIDEITALHEIPVKNDEFDTQEYLLNTASGVVDLKTGKISPFDKKLMLSKNTNTAVNYEEPKVFLKFLHDILKRDDDKETQELVDTMQMALGDALTGRTNKEYLYIMYGNGSNGKSTFVTAIQDVMGDYGTSTNSALLLQNSNASAQSTEFSMSALLGARFISTSETAADKRLDEVTIKQLTSGEKINAQFKFGNPFSFMPTFSIFMSTNNLPIIRATDFGTWRRIFFFPFLNTFTGENKDINMPKKLASESPKILGWIIQGAVRLYNEYDGKLPKPECLEKALAEYKSSMDVIVSYLRSRCVDFPGIRTSATKLYQDYKDWAKSNTEWLQSETRFKKEMIKKGYNVIKDINDGEMYVGIKLAEDKRSFDFSAMGD